jgi:pimeloyl-ACP methyl ester carboxylesterase
MLSTTTVNTTTSNFITANGIKLHYLDHEGDGPPVVLMHGLTANAHAFDGLVAAGLTNRHRVIAVDLRGRGLSDKPVIGYSIRKHAKDIIGLLDHLQIERALIGGHSFGGLLSIYLAKHFPERVERLILLDAAARMHINTRAMLQPAMSRLGQTFPSFNHYLDKVKKAPYNTFWDETMLTYYQADVKDNANGTVKPRSNPRHITEAVLNVLKEPWPFYLNGLHKPAILINATENYTLGAPLLPAENARETVNLMACCQYIPVKGNHQTMLYGEGAKQIVEAITGFLEE